MDFISVSRSVSCVKIEAMMGVYFWPDSVFFLQMPRHFRWKGLTYCRTTWLMGSMLKNIENIEAMVCKTQPKPGKCSKKAGTVAGRTMLNVK